MLGEGIKDSLDLLLPLLCPQPPASFCLWLSLFPFHALAPLLSFSWLLLDFLWLCLGLILGDVGGPLVKARRRKWLTG